MELELQSDRPVPYSTELAKFFPLWCLILGNSKYFVLERAGNEH